MTEEAFRPVARVLDEGVPFATMFRDYLDALERGWPRDPDPVFEEHNSPPDWDALRALDYEAESRVLSEWATGVLDRREIGPEVNGLHLGLLYPARGKRHRCGLFLATTTRFREDHDWAVASEVPGDDAIHYSDTLTSFYRLIADASNAALDPRDSALHGLLVLVAGICAEWTRTGMRDTILGPAKSRGVFVALDPWMGFVIPFARGDDGND